MKMTERGAKVIELMESGKIDEALSIILEHYDMDAMINRIRAWWGDELMPVTIAYDGEWMVSFHIYEPYTALNSVTWEELDRKVRELEDAKAT